MRTDGGANLSSGGGGGGGQFLGGATAAKVRIEDASLFFSVVVGVLAWVGLYLREDRLRALL